MTILEKVRAKIIEAVPEIMELKFGCEIESHNRNGRVFYTGCNDELDENYFVEVDGVANEDEQYYTEGKVVSKILGRHITLPDILRAIKKRTLERWNGDEPMIPNFQEALWSEIKPLLEIWNLEKNLEDQDPPTIEFIAKTLGIV